MIAIAHHQPVPVVVAFIGELGAVGGDLLARNAAASICCTPSRTISSMTDDRRSPSQAPHVTNVVNCAYTDFALPLSYR